MGKPKKDSMLESGYWNGFVNGVPGDDSFHDVINLFDSMESLEGDNSVDVEDWDAQFQSLGPIPSEVLQGFAHVSQANNCNDMQGFCPNNFVPNDGTSELKQLPDVVEVSSDSSRAKKSSLFHTPSPISVLECSGSYSAEKSMSNSPELLIPVRTRSKRHRRSTFCKWHLISPITPSEKTLNKKGKEKKRKKPSQLLEDSEVKENHRHMHSKTCTHCQVTETSQWREGPLGPRTLCNACGVRYRSERKKPSQLPEDSEVKENHQHMHSKTCAHCQVTETPRWREGPMGPRTFCNACGVRYQSEREKPSQLPEDSEVKENHQHMHSKKCTHCQVTKTPQWREGPMGPRTLCNACGVRYRSGRLLPEYRPLASPTFVPSLHSNCHRKVIQMRNKIIQESSMPKMNPAMLPPPEIFPMKVMQMRNKVIQESSMPEMNPTTLPPTEFFPKVVQESLVPEMDPAMSPPPEFVPMSSYLFDRI